MGLGTKDFNTELRSLRGVTRSFGTEQESFFWLSGQVSLRFLIIDGGIYFSRLQGIKREVIQQREKNRHLDAIFDLQYNKRVAKRFKRLLLDEYHRYRSFVPTDCQILIILDGPRRPLAKIKTWYKRWFGKKQWKNPLSQEMEPIAWQDKADGVEWRGAIETALAEVDQRLHEWLVKLKDHKPNFDPRKVAIVHVDTDLHLQNGADICGFSFTRNLGRDEASMAKSWIVVDKSKFEEQTKLNTTTRRLNSFALAGNDYVRTLGLKWSEIVGNQHIRPVLDLEDGKQIGEELLRLGEQGLVESWRKEVERDQKATKWTSWSDRKHLLLNVFPLEYEAAMKVVRCDGTAPHFFPSHPPQLPLDENDKRVGHEEKDSKDGIFFESGGLSKRSTRMWSNGTNSKNPKRVEGGGGRGVKAEAAETERGRQ